MQLLSLRQLRRLRKTVLPAAKFTHQKDLPASKIGSDPLNYHKETLKLLFHKADVYNLKTNTH
jgi:hypothetical protein